MVAAGVDKLYPSLSFSPAIIGLIASALRKPGRVEGTEHPQSLVSRIYTLKPLEGWKFVLFQTASSF